MGARFIALPCSRELNRNKGKTGYRFVAVANKLAEPDREVMNKCVGIFIGLPSDLLLNLERSVVLSFMGSIEPKTFLRDVCIMVNGFLKISHGLFSKKYLVDNSRQNFSSMIFCGISKPPSDG